MSAEALNPDLPRASETLPEALVCPPFHWQLRPCQPQFLADPHTLLWPSCRVPGICASVKLFHGQSHLRPGCRVQA